MNKKGKHTFKRKSNIFLSLVALCLLISVVSKLTEAKYTSEIKQDTFNVEFIAGDIKVELTESANEFVIVPGKTITKDTKMTVEAESEACYLFVEFEKSENFDDYIEYEVANEWTILEDNTNVYYCELPKTTVDSDVYIFKDNQIAVKDTVTKQNFEVLTSNISLNFTGYAVQKSSEIATAADAWNMVSL